MKEKIILTTGGFDPIHSGHIEYFKSAKEICDYLIVGLNSDEWLSRKKKYSFMPFSERAHIIRNIKHVDEVIEFNDADNSASDAISKCLSISEHVIFANGGDRSSENIPELIKFQDDKRVSFSFGVGGSNKRNSSSWVMKDFLSTYSKIRDLPNPLIETLNIEAPWGNHITIIDEPGYKLKQLNINPGAKLSLQYHHHRLEHWIVVQGIATVQIGEDSFDVPQGNYEFIPLGEKHRLSNNTKNPLVLIEVQCGDILDESDIVRLEDSFGRVTSSGN